MQSFLTNLFKQKPLEIKSCTGFNLLTYGSIEDVLASPWHKDFNSKEMLRLYKESGIVYNAINKIATLMSSLPFEVKDSKGKIDENHEVLKLLNKPSFGITSREFKYQFATNTLIYGNNFFREGVGISKPLTLLNWTPININHTIQEGIVYKYTRTLKKGKQEDYILDKTKRVRSDYIPLYTDREGNILWHSKQYNADENAVMGLSPLQPINININSIIKSNAHNIAVIENGGRPTGIVIYDGNLDNEDFDKIKDQMAQKHTGVDNAGKLLLLEGKFDYKEASISPKDMDWIEGIKINEKDIYNALGIPLALIDSNASSFNNMFTSMYAIYEHSVFPLMEKMCGELTDLLMWQYNNNSNEELTITYSKEKIPSLDALKTESLTNKTIAGIYTLNELRKEQGLDELDGGNIIVNNFANNSPLGVENPIAPEKKVSKEIFREIERKSGVPEEMIDNYIEIGETKGVF